MTMTTARVHNIHSLFKQVIEAPAHHCAAHARVILCDGDDGDVIECSKCGRQWTARCTFDDDYS